RPGPSKSTSVSGVVDWVSYGRFQFENYTYDARAALRLQTFLDNCAKQKRISKGTWSERVFIGFLLFSRISRSWIKYHLEEGTAGWDKTIARLPSIVLVAGCMARAGDAAVGKGSGVQRFRR
ncbi:MAG: hypothetical protein L6R42_010222, partial [Xanthoria sp. 1 TBL-2021]